MKKMKKITAILLALVLCLALAACGGNKDEVSTGGAEQPASTGSESTPAAPGGNAPAATAGESAVLPGQAIEAPEGAKFADSIVIQLEMPNTVVDPLHPSGGGGGQVLVYRCVMDTLISRTIDGDFLPDLATEWSTDDYQTYHFKLRDDVTWHNGQKFTAQDIADTVFVAERDGVGSNGYETWRDVKEVNIINDYEVEIVLNNVNVDFFFLLSLPVGSIVNKAARDADPVMGAMVGTGTYIVTEFASGGDAMTMVRNENYWGEPAITETIYLRFTPETVARAIMLENGEADICLSVGIEDYPRFVDNPDYTIYYYIHILGWVLYMNDQNPITGDINFRKAVAYALNFDDIAIAATGDWAVSTTDGALWGYGTEFRNTDVPKLKQDVELAKQYLADSNYDGSEVQIMAGIPPNISCQDLIAEQLAAIGIKTSLFNTDNSIIISMDQFTPETQMINGVAPFSLSAVSCRNMFLPTGGANRGKYTNQQVIDLLATAPSILDAKEREAVYKQVQQLVFDDYTQLSMFYRAKPITALSSIGGIITSSDDSHDFRYVFKVLD